MVKKCPVLLASYKSRRTDVSIPLIAYNLSSKIFAANYLMTYMSRFFLAKHPLIGTKNKPAALHLQQRSPYYWWWAYLKRNADYIACCDGGGAGELAALYKDFGDVRGDDFRTWWGAPNNKGAYLFLEQALELSVQKIDTPQQWDSRWGDNVLVVAVNLELGRRKAQKQFADLLLAESFSKRGRKSMSTTISTARYALHRNFTSNNLKVMLSVYDAVTANDVLQKEERLKLWQIGESLKLAPVAMPSKYDNAYDTRDKHKTMTMTVSRHYSNARAIVANTAKSEFPNSVL